MFWANGVWSNGGGGSLEKTSFTHTEVFPIIRRIINGAFEKSQRWVTHKEICFCLLEDNEGRALVERSREGDDKSSEWWASNMVQWFSQKYTKEYFELISSYERSEIDGRWAYKPKQRVLSIAEEVIGLNFPEGAVERISTNRYERDPRARTECVEHYGSRCFICSFDFGDFYGEALSGYIHVHHLRPLATVGPGYRANPIEDLRPVCPNCHNALHRFTPPLSPDEVKILIEKAGKKNSHRE